MHRKRAHTKRRNTPSRRDTRLAVLACLALIVILALLPRQEALRYVYPLRYKDTVLREAARNGIDPLLVAAVARVESHFAAAAVSHKGAIGIMQVMPSTGAWVAGRLHLRNWRDERLFDPHTNIQVGTWYLSYLLERFDGKVVPAIAAYNGGYGNVQKWLDSGAWDGTARRANRIPFPETRRYVNRVLRTYDWYRRAYPDTSGRAWAVPTANAASAGTALSLTK